MYIRLHENVKISLFNLKINLFDTINKKCNEFFLLIIQKLKVKIFHPLCQVINSS